MNGNVPRLIIGGASKSGTTALYYYLKQHPEFCMPEKKELHFFSRHSLEKTVAGPGDSFVLAEIPMTVGEYLSFFNHCGNGKVAVDISPSYLFHQEAADEIKRYLDDARVVFVLRNPADKAFSQYMHLVGAGRETLGFEDALTAEKERKVQGYADIWLYKESGFYADSLSHFMSILGRENIKVFFHDEFLADPDYVLREICASCNVDPSFRFDPVSEINRSGRPKSMLVAKLTAPNAFTYLMRRIVPQGIGRVLRKLLKDLNTGEKPKMDQNLRIRLLADYAEDIRKVEALIGRKSGWIG